MFFILNSLFNFDQFVICNNLLFTNPDDYVYNASIMKNIKINPNTTLLALIFIGIVYIIWAGINPVNQYRAYKERKMLETIASKVNVKVTEATAMVEIGKTPNFDLDKIRKGSKIDEEVYKDAKNGDRVVSFTTKMAIYRPSTGSIIYQGETPGQIQTKQNKERLDKVLAALKAANIIPADSEEVPQASEVNNADQLKANAFYKDVANGNLILNFGTLGIVIIYDESSNKVVNMGRIKFEQAAGTTTKTEKKEATTKENTQ